MDVFFKQWVSIMLKIGIALFERFLSYSNLKGTKNCPLIRVNANKPGVCRRQLALSLLYDKGSQRGLILPNLGVNLMMLKLQYFVFLQC